MTVGEAANRHGLGARTLARYLAQERGKGGAPPSPRPAAPKATKARPAPAAEVPLDEEPVPDGTGDSLIATLEVELRHARAARKAASTDAEKRHWTKIVRELVHEMERIAPPPPPSPDELIERLRALDGEVLRRIEEHAPVPIEPKEIAA